MAEGVALRVQCAWCKSIKLAGTYHRCPGVPLLNSLSDNVSHGICPACTAHLEARAQAGRTEIPSHLPREPTSQQLPLLSTDQHPAVS